MGVWNSTIGNQSVITRHDNQDHQESVLDKDLVTAPLNPSDGDRYIMAGIGGAWSNGVINNIAEFRNGDWVFITVNAGADTYVEDENDKYVFNGTVWVSASSTFDHGLLMGLGDDDHTQYHNNARGDARYYTKTLLDSGQLDNRYFTEAEHIDTSAGAGDAGKPIKLDGTGKLDSSIVPVSGWTDDGTTVRLTTASDVVAIGTATPESGKRLTINGHISVGDANLNLFAGIRAGDSITTGLKDVGVGQNSLTNATTARRCFGGGVNSCQLNTTGDDLVGVGDSALSGNTTGNGSTVVGSNTFIFNTTGSNNVVIGVFGALRHADGSTQLTDAENSIYIGAETRGFNNSDNNSIVVAYQGIGKGANTAVWGNTSIIEHYFSGNIGLAVTSFPASATKSFIMNNGVAPTSDVADQFTFYSADIVAGNAAPHFRTELGDVIKLYKISTGWSVTNLTPTRTYDANATTLDEVADVLGTLLEDLKLSGLIAA